MSHWEKQFKSNPIHTTLHNLQVLLDDDAVITENIDDMGLIDRISQATIYTESCLNNVLPALVLHVNLTSANTYLQNILNELNAYKTNKNVNHLNNTANHIDNLINQLSNFPIPRPRLEEEVFSKSIITFKSKAEKIISSLADKKEQLQQQLDEMSVASSDVGQKFGVLLSSINSQEVLIGNTIDKQQVLIETTLDSFKSDFSSLGKNISNQIDTDIQKSSKQNEELRKTLQSKHEKLVESNKNDADSLLLELESKKEEASNLVQIIGNIGITGNYQKIANQEKKSADWLRVIALLLMLLMVVAIGLTIFLSVENGFDWKLAIFRLLATLVLAIPATYAAKESSKHRMLENYNRKAELELASLDPYLEKLPEEKRNLIKESLTEKFFGLDVKKNVPDDSVTHSSLIDLIKLLIKNK